MIVINNFILFRLKVSKEVSIEYLDMRLIRMGKINETMFIGCSNGEVAAASSSLQEPFDCMSYKIHCHPITQVLHIKSE